MNKMKKGGLTLTFDILLQNKQWDWTQVVTTYRSPLPTNYIQKYMMAIDILTVYKYNKYCTKQRRRNNNKIVKKKMKN